MNQQHYKIGNGIEVTVSDRVIEVNRRQMAKKDFAIITPKQSVSFTLDAKRASVLEQVISRAAHRGN